MWNYIEGLKELQRENKLILEAIVPDVYESLVHHKCIAEDDHLRFADAAGRYLLEYHRQHPKTLRECIESPVKDQDARSKSEELARLNLAKKFSIYDYVRRLNESYAKKLPGLEELPAKG
jgi:hypothetical protein